MSASHMLLFYILHIYIVKCSEKLMHVTVTMLHQEIYGKCILPLTSCLS